MQKGKEYRTDEQGFQNAEGREKNTEQMNQPAARRQGFQNAEVKVLGIFLRYLRNNLRDLREKQRELRTIEQGFKNAEVILSFLNQNSLFICS